MSFRNFRGQVVEALRRGTKTLGYEVSEADMSFPPNPEYGDLSSTIALRLARTQKRSPTMLAASIVADMSLEGLDLIAEAKPHPQGYVNFKVNIKQLTFGVLSEAHGNEDYGLPSLGNSKSILIEHTSVNPNKAIHYGHLRNIFLGDAIYRLLKHTGHDVKVLNYIDDSGAQVADIVVGFLHLNMPLEPPSGMKFDHYCGDSVYVKVNEAYESNPSLISKRKEILREMEKEGSSTAKFARDLTGKILLDQLDTCWRFGARYDLLNFESQILRMKLWEKLFETMRQKEIVRYVADGKHAGCWVVSAGEEEEDKVLVRSDGTVTYTGKDIPYAAWKIGLLEDPFGYDIFARQADGSIVWMTTEKGLGYEPTGPNFWGATVAITITDVRQTRLQNIVKQVLSELSGGKVAERYMHIGYEVVSLSARTAEELGISKSSQQILHMSGRKGIYVNADVVLEAVAEKAYKEAKSRNPDQSEEWLRDVAHKISVASMRFDVLRHDLEKMIVFDMAEALKLEGETGPYVQYTYARASRILEKAGGVPQLSMEESDLLKDQYEIELVKLISKLDMYVEDAAKDLSPKVIARYGYILAVNFNAFYEHLPVLQEENSHLRRARICLVEAFTRACKNSMKLLGIELPSRI